MTYRDPWGSPYDPRNGGKIQRETAQEMRERREREQHILRGCGDPGCAMCNPQTAARGGNSSMTNPYRDTPLNMGSEFLRRAMDNMYERPESISRIQEAYYGEAPSARASTPASFTRAREAVKDWIVAAPAQAFDDIIGNDEALALLRDAIEAPVKHKALYAAYGMKMPKGALLSGPPGCGKTMFARATAAEMKRLYGSDLEFISISGSELQSMYVGETEGRIKAIFTYAREYKAYRGHPLLVFMDEAEVLLPDRTGRVRRVAPWEESQVATFLAEMDGMQESGAFVLLATNRPEVIDQAVLRDGRCDFKIEVARPTQQAVEMILRRNFVEVPLGNDDLETLIFAALESLYAPDRVIIEAHAIRIRIGQEGPELDTRGKHFLLEHIISGAMAASIPTRAKRHAFARDKAAGIAKGVTTAEVVKAVSDLFNENRSLDHSFALDRFKRDFLAELSETDGAKGGD
jgi:SpoVK/Ycf46/Vps4 family AAA+-type ATPase